MRLAALSLVVLAAGLRAQAPALSDAIQRKDVEAVKKALDGGAEVNIENAPATPLTIAALKLGADDDAGEKIVSLLLSAEADPNQAGDVRPLYAAILRGNARAADMLILAGADPDAAGCIRPTIPGTVEGQTARALAQKRGEPFISIVAKAKPLPPKPPRKTELKRTTLCSD